MLVAARALPSSFPKFGVQIILKATRTLVPTHSFQEVSRPFQVPRGFIGALGDAPGFNCRLVGNYTHLQQVKHILMGEVMPKRPSVGGEFVFA